MWKWKGDAWQFKQGRDLSSSLRTADVIPVVASLPPKNNVSGPVRQIDFRDVKPL